MMMYLHIKILEIISIKSRSIIVSIVDFSLLKIKIKINVLFLRYIFFSKRSLSDLRDVINIILH